MDIFHVHIPMALKSKSNYSYSAATKNRHKELQAYEQTVTLLSLAALPEDWPLGDEHDPVTQRPQVLLGIVGINSGYDSANFTKSIADGLEGVLYWNDKSAVDTVTRSITVEGTDPSHDIIAIALPADATVEQRNEALMEMTRRINSVTSDATGS